MLRIVLLTAFSLSGNLPTAGASTVELTRPSQADPGVQNFDSPNLIIDNGRKDTPLVVFLPGTNGAPADVRPLLEMVAAQGYRVIGLSYNDTPAVAQVCPNDPDPGCAAKFRAVRSFGDGNGPVSNSVQEGIESRLVSLLRYLDREHPDREWGRYLDGARPKWARLVLSGLSQGAGMAAFIAKREEVARVVLFSSPWDTTGPHAVPAPWLYAPSGTPMERWWAERHASERTTVLIAQAYAALQIPVDHIMVFDKPLPPGFHPAGGNPFHGATAHQIDYAPAWKTMFGHP